MGRCPIQTIPFSIAFRVGVFNIFSAGKCCSDDHTVCDTVGEVAGVQDLQELQNGPVDFRLVESCKLLRFALD